MTLQPITLYGFPQGGLEQDVKPAFLPENAFPLLENAYVYRNRVVKRLCNSLVGRLRRFLTAQNLGNTDGAGNFSGNIISILGLEAGATIQQGTISITVGAQVFEEPDPPDGTLSSVGGGTGTINYATGALTINTNPDLAGVAVMIDFGYFPNLPVMGIWQRERADINDEQTVFWDTKYAYVFTGTNFVEFIPGTTWSGTDSDFFSIANYRGILPQDRLFFATNFVNNAANPIRYTDQATVAWTPFAPLVSATNTLYQARIIIPYYGRLFMLNVYEGTTAGGYAGAVNIPNRAVFSAVGNPLDADAFRRDIFGKGGFIDAPVNEDIISASFFKNTLIVQFERSTWQIRYLGDYGLSFLWERISSDFGCESTFSSIIFDQGVASVGDRAITSATSNTVIRIDEQIPDKVFDFLNRDNGVKRVWGIRDFQKELAFWCYPERNDLEEAQYFPNRTLLYNYRNNTYAILRNNITAFGLLQLISGVTWDSTDVFWDDMDVFWDDVQEQSKFPRVVIGNQQGYVHYYGYSTEDDPSLEISAIDLTVTPVKLTIVKHNLATQELIYVTGILVNGNVSSALNNEIYQVTYVDVNNVTITEWDGTNYVNVAPPAGETSYLGGGQVTLLPQMRFETKDFNPYQQQGLQMRMSHIDFQTDVQPPEEGSAISVNVILNGTGSDANVFGNLLVGNTNIENSLTSPFYTPGSFYAWHRFFANTFGQYLRIQITYDDELMNTLATHQQSFELNAINIWTKPGGKIPF